MSGAGVDEFTMARLKAGAFKMKVNTVDLLRKQLHLALQILEEEPSSELTFDTICTIGASIQTVASTMQLLYQMLDDKKEVP